MAVQLGRAQRRASRICERALRNPSLGVLVPGLGRWRFIACGPGRSCLGTDGTNDRTAVDVSAHCIAASNASPCCGAFAALQLPAAEVVVLMPPLHSISETFWCIWYNSNRSFARAWHGSSCGKKIKKDLTSIITWDIKGVLTRKTKGK